MIFNKIKTVLVSLVMFIVLASLAGCTDEQGATNALTASGFKDINLIGWTNGCSKDDYSCTEFYAKGPTGINAHGAVGCGAFFKGCTVRIF